MSLYYNAESFAVLERFVPQTIRSVDGRETGLRFPPHVRTSARAVQLSREEDSPTVRGRPSGEETVCRVKM